MQQYRVQPKIPALKRLEELSDNHRAWLEHYFNESHDLKITADYFGVSPQAIGYVRDSPAGQGYALKRMGSSRSSMNLHAAHLIMQRMTAQGATIPLELLVRVYSATLPKDSPQGQMNELLDYAERIANQYGFNDAERSQLLELISNGGS